MDIKQLILTTSELLAGIVDSVGSSERDLDLYGRSWITGRELLWGERFMYSPHGCLGKSRRSLCTQFYGAAVSSVSRASLLTGQIRQTCGTDRKRRR